MEQQTEKQISLLSFCDELSTRILLESALDPDIYRLDFSKGDETLMEAVRKREHDIYIIDACHNCCKEHFRLLHEAVSQELDGPVRILLLIDRVPPGASDKMSQFGPLCVLECFFTRAKLRGAIAKIMEMSGPDGGAADDARHLDFTVFSKDNQAEAQ